MAVPLKHWIKNVSLVKIWVLLCESLPLGSEDIMVVWHIVVFYGSVIVISVYVKSLFNFSFQDSNGWLLYSQVGHFDIESMEMNSLKAITNIACKSWFADSFKSLVIWNGAGLMVVSEKIVEVNDGSRVDHPFVPIWRIGESFMLTLELINDWFIIPWESQKITMFIFIKSLIGSYSIIEFWNGSILLWRFGSCYLAGEESWLNSQESLSSINRSRRSHHFG